MLYLGIVSHPEKPSVTNREGDIYRGRVFGDGEGGKSGNEEMKRKRNGN